MIHTSCKDCILAEYSNITQTDCKAHLLEKYQKLKVPIVEVFDEEKEFFVVEGRQCTYYRNKDWLDFHKNKHYLHEWIRQIQREIEIQCDIIAPFKDFEDFEKRKTFLLSLNKSKVKPRTLIITFQEPILQISAKTKLPALRPEYLWCQQNISTQTIIEYPLEKISLEKSIDNAVGKTKHCYLVLQDILSKFLLKRINDKINEDLWQVGAVLPPNNINNYHVLFVNTHIHNMLGGFDYDLTIIDKINSIIQKCKEDCKHMFLTYDQI